MSRTVRSKGYGICPDGHDCEWCRPRDKYLKRFIGRVHRIKNNDMEVTQ